MQHSNTLGHGVHPLQRMSSCCQKDEFGLLPRLSATTGHIVSVRCLTPGWVSIVAISGRNMRHSNSSQCYYCDYRRPGLQTTRLVAQGVASGSLLCGPILITSARADTL